MLIRLHIVTDERDSLKRVLAAFTPKSPPYEPGWLARHPGVIMALGAGSAIMVFAVAIAFQRMF